LVVSTLLIAAGGNIINDYFDVKADRINKPNKLIISKHIKPRWAILSHWFLNGIALLIGTYLSIKYTSFSFAFIYLVCINALWFYSVYFKRKAFVGNFIVSVLTALVPTTCGIYFHFTGLNQPYVSNNFWLDYLHEDYRLIFGMAIFAFLLNLAREIVKDIQDVKGDLELHATTLPIVFGRKAAKWSAAFILLSIPSISIFLYIPHMQTLDEDLLFFMPFVLALLLVSISFLLILQTNQIKAVDRLLKISMFLGLILPLYWFFY
jgi:4-hydroxybenzoate polyprenyltransferase